MYQKNENEGAGKIIKKITGFIQSKSLLLITVMGILAAGLIAVFIYDKVTKDTQEESARIIEDYETTCEEWQTESGLEKKTELENNLLGGLQEVSEKYSGYYAGKKALFLLAEIHFANREYEKANELYIKVSEKSTHLAQAGLFFSALCYEELDNQEKALEQYKSLLKKYKKSPYTPHVLFSIGRINEGMGNYAQALEVYEKLRNEYSYSDWTKLAINRILYLQVSGLE